MRTYFHLLFLVLGCSHYSFAWFFLFPKSEPLGGKHLVDAGEALRKAADCFQQDDGGAYAYPCILREAGDSLKDAGEAWNENHWEGVAYAVDDCSISFRMLSQLGKSPKMQKAYRGASGEFKAVAGLADPSQESGPNLMALARYLKEVARDPLLDNSKKRSKMDVSGVSKALREASNSVQTLGRETTMNQ